MTQKQFFEGLALMAGYALAKNVLSIDEYKQKRELGMQIAEDFKAEIVKLISEEKNELSHEQKRELLGWQKLNLDTIGDQNFFAMVRSEHSPDELDACEKQLIRVVRLDNNNISIRNEFGGYYQPEQIAAVFPIPDFHRWEL